MDFELSEDQRAIAEMADGLFVDHCHDDYMRQWDVSGEPMMAPLWALCIETGLQALAEHVTVPVIGIGQASMMQAARAGSPFGIATTTPGLEQSILDQVRRYGWSDQFSGLRLTPTAPLDLAQAPERQDQELADSVVACIEQDGARAVIIGGGPLAHQHSGTERNGAGTQAHKYISFIDVGPAKQLSM